MRHWTQAAIPSISGRPEGLSPCEISANLSSMSDVKFLQTATCSADKTLAQKLPVCSIFRHVRETLAPYKRVRRLEFSDLPKTISGKIRRVELRRTEEDRASAGTRDTGEFREEDFPELRQA